MREEAASEVERHALHVADGPHPAAATRRGGTPGAGRQAGARASNGGSAGTNFACAAAEHAQGSERSREGTVGGEEAPVRMGLATGRGRQAACRRRAPVKPHQRDRSSGAGRPAPPHPSPGFQRAGRLERPAQPHAPGSRAYGPFPERPPRHAARLSGSSCPTATLLTRFRAVPHPRRPSHPLPSRNSHQSRGLPGLVAVLHYPAHPNSKTVSPLPSANELFNSWSDPRAQSYTWQHCSSFVFLLQVSQRSVAFIFIGDRGTGQFCYFKDTVWLLQEYVWLLQE